MSLNVNAYVVIDAGCPIAISVRKPEHVDIVCGWTPHPAFEFSLHREALRALVEVGTEPLHRMDADLADDSAPSARTAN